MKLKTFRRLYIQVYLIILFSILNKVTNISPEIWHGFPFKFLYEDITSSGCSALYLLPLFIDIAFCGLVTYLISKLLWAMVKKANKWIEYTITFLLYLFSTASFLLFFIWIVISVAASDIDPICVLWRYGGRVYFYLRRHYY